MSKKLILLLVVIITLSSCSSKMTEVSKVKENSQDLEMISAYKEGFEALESGDPYYASRKFLEAELIFPQSEWAPKAALMASYSFYMYNFYAETLSNLERFFKTYPNHENIDYAHYLSALCYYEMIEDEKRDTKPLLESKKKFEFVVKNYPNTDFALDARFKLDLIQDMLASKEMYLGRHYLKKEKWIAAINRFKTVVSKYEKTIFIEEALYRLVEINYKIGLENEAQKYAKILGYNYLSSDWYSKSYKILNQNYEVKIKRLNTKEKKGLLNRFKKLFE